MLVYFDSSFDLLPEEGLSSNKILEAGE